MPIVKQWEQFEPEEWATFARSWLSRTRGEPPPPETELGRVERFARRLQEAMLGPPKSADVDVRQLVVMMNFTAGPEPQWQFVLAAVAFATSDDELGDLAAGPLEHLLGWHGEAWIERVEDEAASDPTFARTLTGVWKYRMTPPVWARVQALQARVGEPLRKSS
jgi:hypothetical protein